jgi:hypothetical protein
VRKAQSRAQPDPSKHCVLPQCRALPSFLGNILAEFHMQFSAQILQQSLQIGWSSLLGWALIVAGLAISALALSHKRIPMPRLVPAGGWRPASQRRGFALDLPARRLDPGAQWTRLENIVTLGYCCIEVAAALQAQAADEIEAADEALCELLADMAGAQPVPAAASVLLPHRQPTPAPAPTAQPLAA